MTTLNLDVKGMSCNHCKNQVESALNCLSGVEDVQVDIKSGKVIVEFNSYMVNPNIIENQIEDQGYQVNNRIT